MDQWDKKNLQNIVQDIFSQHNEHRILVPRLFFLVDMYFFSGRNEFLVTMIVLCQLIHVGLFWWIIGFAQNVSAFQRITLTLMASILFLSLLQYENFLWGFQIQFVGVFAAATAAFGSIAQSTEAHSRQTSDSEFKSLLWLGVGMTCLIISMLMMSNGLLSGILLTILAFWLRAERVHFTAIFVLFLAVTGIYLYDFHSPQGHAKPLESLAQFDHVLVYAATYLGGPFGSILSDVFRYLQPFHMGAGIFTAQVMGLFGMVISAILGLLVVSRGRDQVCRAEAVLLMIMAMVVGSALVTGLGRLNFSYGQALSSRYMTPALLFWAAAGTLACVIASRLLSRTRQFLSIFGITLLVSLTTIIVIHQVFLIQHLVENRSSRDQAGVALILNVKDEETIKEIHPDIQLIWEAREFMRQNRISVFSESFAGWYGVNIHDHFDLARRNRCQGFFDTVSSIIPSGLRELEVHGRVTGWAWDNERASVPRTVIITDERDIVVGLGLGGYQRPDVSKTLSSVTSAKSGWRGFVNSVAGNSLAAYAVLDGGQMLCRLEQMHAAPAPLVAIDELKEAVAISIAEVQFDNTWQVNGDDSANVPRPNLISTVYGSWSGDDAHVGRLTIAGLPIPPSHRIAIPFTTGPSPSNLFITIRNSAGRELMRSQLASPMKWVGLVVAFPPDSGSTFDLLVDDNGRDWGQWMAIGEPRTLPVQ